MKRSYLFAATTLALSLAGCGTTIGPSSSAAGASSNGTSSAGTSGKTTSAGTTSNTSAGTSTGTSQGTSKETSEGTSQGGTSSGTSSGTSEGTSQGTSSETSQPTGTKTIYFEDQPWWNSYADYPMALLTSSDGASKNTPSDAPTDDKGNVMPGVKMTAVGSHTVSATEIYNFWSIDVDLATYASVTFYRYGDYLGKYYYGGTLTDTYTLSELGENDLYILGATAAWDGKKAATTLGKFDSSMIDAPVEYVTVTLDLNYDGAPAATTVKAEKGKAMSKPTATRSGYTLEGWYSDKACTSAFDFATLVSADFTLYAKWTEGAVAGEHDNGGSLTTFYIRGAVNGSTDWTTGIQMYTDAVSTNKALYLNIAMLVGDSFKVVDMTSGTAQWNGFDAVDSASTAYSNFSGKDDGYGGKNISVVTAGSYDVYFSSASKIVLNLHA
jgi:uncharacterized repeat protein (TIGR02543 family)